MAARCVWDFTTGDHDQLSRELSQISQSNQVNDELAKLKAEVGSGDAPKEIPAAPAGDEAPAQDAPQQS